MKQDRFEASGLPSLELFLRDVLYGLRTMRNNRGFALATVLTLAIGVCGNTAMFTVIRAVLLKPLAKLGYGDADRLVFSCGGPVLTHAGFADLDAEFEQFAVNPRSAPRWGFRGSLFESTGALSLSPPAAPPSHAESSRSGRRERRCGASPARWRLS